jgi:hypothetical protein
MNENVNAAVWPTPNIQVIVTRSNLPYTFGRVIGLSTYNVAAAATAADPVVNAMQGMFPMGMQCKSLCSLSGLVTGDPVPFNFKFTPAVLSGTPAPGNWQWLDNGQGANGLGDAVTNGMSGTFSTTESITTKPGNDGDSGPVKKAWSDRFSNSNCPASAIVNGVTVNQDPCNGGTAPEGDPCLVTVPAVDFGAGCGGGCTITIEAFAQIYIELGATSTTFKACYVKQADSNAIGGSTTATNLGTSIIRLYQ